MHRTKKTSFLMLGLDLLYTEIWFKGSYLHGRVRLMLIKGDLRTSMC